MEIRDWFGSGQSVPQEQRAKTLGTKVSAPRAYINGRPDEIDRSLQLQLSEKASQRPDPGPFGVPSGGILKSGLGVKETKISRISVGNILRIKLFVASKPGILSTIGASRTGVVDSVHIHSRTAELSQRPV